MFRQKLESVHQAPGASASQEMLPGYKNIPNWNQQKRDRCLPCFAWQGDSNNAGNSNTEILVTDKKTSLHQPSTNRRDCWSCHHQRKGRRLGATKRFN